MDDLDFKRGNCLKACLEGKKSERNTSQTNEINVLLGNLNRRFRNKEKVIITHVLPRLLFSQFKCVFSLTDRRAKQLSLEDNF